MGNAVELRDGKLLDQRAYWTRRGATYASEIAGTAYLERERFFQDMLASFLHRVGCGSCFEAGCGFGWNLKRMREEFPGARVGGVDFSPTQLAAARRYLPDTRFALTLGDNCRIPLRDNAFEVGFSVGVFMNIHPEKIRAAAGEMLRVSSRYVIHLEYDDSNTTDALRDKRAPRSNIVSHDYRAIYQDLGREIVCFQTHRDFGDAFRAHELSLVRRIEQRFDGFEGAEKYVFLVVKASEDRDAAP